MTTDRMGADSLVYSPAAHSTVADFLLERLRAWEVTHVFGYPGDGIDGILGAFSRADDQPRFILARHEEMASFEAVGYAKFGGHPGVCLATSGPGAIHLLNGLYYASSTTSPSWRSSASPTAQPWVAATGRRWTSSACSRRRERLSAGGDGP